MGRWSAILLLVVLLAAPGATGFQEPDDCDLPIVRSYRAAVKNRSPSQSGYVTFSHGVPITVSDWYRKLTRTLETRLPRDPRTGAVRKPRTNTPAMRGIETIRVTLRGYLVGVEFERHIAGSHDGKDNDLHCEIAGEATWNTDHVVVEVPPGQAYCEARKTAWRLAKVDSRDSGQPLTDRYIFEEAPYVDVEGFVFLDGARARKGTIHVADVVGSETGQAITWRGKPRRVRGLWEIHPVIAVRPVR